MSLYALCLIQNVSSLSASFSVSIVAKADSNLTTSSILDLSESSTSIAHFSNPLSRSGQSNIGLKSQVKGAFRLLQVGLQLISIQRPLKVLSNSHHPWLECPKICPIDSITILVHHTMTMIWNKAHIDKMVQSKLLDEESLIRQGQKGWQTGWPKGTPTYVTLSFSTLYAHDLCAQKVLSSHSYD